MTFLSEDKYNVSSICHADQGEEELWQQVLRGRSERLLMTVVRSSDVDVMMLTQMTQGKG